MDKGLLTVASTTCLLAISRRELVASIAGKPVYCISEVAMLPLSSQLDAEKAILKARDSQLRHAHSAEEALTDVSDDEDTISLAEEEQAAGDPDPEPAKVTDEATAKPSAVSQQAAARSVLFGRFAERWMSIRGAAPRVRATAGKDPTDKSVNNPSQAEVLAVQDTGSIQPDYKQPPISDTLVVSHDPASADDPAIADDSVLVDDPTVNTARLESQTNSVPAPILKLEKVPISLIPKLLRTSRFLFSSKNFFFSYDHDISRRSSGLADQQDSLEMYESFDPSVRLR
jgi:hypothetical protein